MRILDEESVIQRPRLGSKASDQKTQNSTTEVTSAPYRAYRYNSIGYLMPIMAACGVHRGKIHTCAFKASMSFRRHINESIWYLDDANKLESPYIYAFIVNLKPYIYENDW